MKPSFVGRKAQIGKKSRKRYNKRGVRLLQKREGKMNFSEEEGGINQEGKFPNGGEGG